MRRTASSFAATVLKEHTALKLQKAGSAFALVATRPALFWRWRFRYTRKFANTLVRDSVGSVNDAPRGSNSFMNRIAAILPAAGLGTRMGAETPKQFLELAGTPIVVHTVRRMASCPMITDIIVATRGDVVGSLETSLQGEKFKQNVKVIRGGDSRQESVALALQQVPDDTEIVLVHDS